METTTGFSDTPYDTMESNDMKDTKAKQMKYKMDSHWCCGRAKDFAVATLALLGFLIAIIALILSCYNMYVLTNKLAHLEGLNGSDSLQKGPTVTASALKSDVTGDTNIAKIVNSSTTDKSSPTTATTTVVSSSTTTPMPTTSTASTTTTTPMPTTSTASTTTTTPEPKISSETSTMNSSTTTVEATSDVGSGVVYTRWGRGGCGSDSQVIYSGFAAGSSSGSPRIPGGGLNYLCMPEAPEYNRWDNRDDHLAASWVFVARFLSFEIGIFDNTHHGGIPKCSLCHSPRSAKVMIPAKRTCPSGWTKEYEGYLMSSSSTQQKSTFECFDETPDILTVPANRTDGYGGARLYFASGSCNPSNSGHFPFCPPYQGARELTCVICTK